MFDRDTHIIIEGEEMNSGKTRLLAALMSAAVTLSAFAGTAAFAAAGAIAMGIFAVSSIARVFRVVIRKKGI